MSVSFPMELIDWRKKELWQLGFILRIVNKILVDDLNDKEESSLNSSTTGQ